MVYTRKYYWLCPSIWKHVLVLLLFLQMFCFSTVSFFFFIDLIIFLFFLFSLEAVAIVQCNKDAILWVALLIELKASAKNSIQIDFFIGMLWLKIDRSANLNWGVLQLSHQFIKCKYWPDENVTVCVCVCVKRTSFNDSLKKIRLEIHRFFWLIALNQNQNSWRG